MPYNTYSSRRSPSSSRQHFGGSSRPKRAGMHGVYIDPKRFVKAATLSEQAPFIAVHQFADFAVAPLIKQNLIAKNYQTPTPIQDQAIPLGLAGKDIIGLANTGTGKTAAFAIPALHRLMLEANSRALIIAPTRELAQQIEQECRWIAKGSGLTGAVLIGGAAMGPQLRDLRGDPQIVIGTPGRIKDHIDRGTLNLKTFNIVVLDEVDRMLDMGFVQDVRTILSDINPDRQSFFFSATLDAKVRTLIETFARDPETISVKSGDTVDSVHQDVINFGGTTEKLDKLHDLLIDPKVEKVIVFDETQRSVERLSKELTARGFKADAIHGGKTQGQRQRALDQFKGNRINILVATDVAARGIDVTGITHVVNYTVPHTYEDYVHRIGRAGRAGQIGYALTFVPR
jgi:ATP-dependent RNA helicase RhlE